MTPRINLIQQIRANLREGSVSIGGWMQIPHGAIAEIMGQSGFDWVAIDMEHGSISHHQLPDLFRAIQLGDTLPLARLPEGTAKECKLALDAGAGGVIVPMVESREQLIDVRNAICWPPNGNRGVGYSRANLFGKYFESYSLEAQAPMLIAMIESVQGLDNLDSILDVEGLDAILVGPYDLSASMQLTGQFNHPLFINKMTTILAKTSTASVAAGVHVISPSEQELANRIRDGFRFVAYSIDAVMLMSACHRPSVPFLD